MSRTVMKCAMYVTAGRDDLNVTLKLFGLDVSIFMYSDFLVIFFSFFSPILDFENLPFLL